MAISRLFFMGIVIAIVARLFWLRDVEPALVGSVGVVLLCTMVWCTQVWVDYILPFGFWASKASDFGSPGKSSGGLVLMAWVLLLLMGYNVYF